MDEDKDKIQDQKLDIGEAPQKKEDTLQDTKSIRTYEEDVAEALKQKGGSLGNVFMAENKKRESGGASEFERVQSGNKNKLMATSAVIVLFVSLLILSGVFVWKNFLQKEITPGETLSSLISSDSKVSVAITGKSPDAVLNLLREMRDKAEGSLGNIVSVSLYKEEGGGEGVSKNIFLESGDFFKAINSSAPDRLHRSLLPRFMVGIHLFDGNEPFLLFRVDSYQNSFASMLEWERYMESDLSVFFAPRPKAVLNPQGSESLDEKNSTSTDQSGKVDEVVSPPAPRNFEDAIIRNKDVRVLRDSSGRVFLLYSFLDRKTLLITTNENTFKEVLDRTLVASFED